MVVCLCVLMCDVVCCRRCVVGCVTVVVDASTQKRHVTSMTVHEKCNRTRITSASFELHYIVFV